MAGVEAEARENGPVKVLGKIDDRRTPAARTTAQRGVAGRALDTAGA